MDGDDDDDSDNDDDYDNDNDSDWMMMMMMMMMMMTLMMMMTIMIVMGTVGDFVLVVVVVVINNFLGKKKVLFEKTRKIIIDLILGSAGNICVQCTVTIRGEQFFFGQILLIYNVHFRYVSK